MVEFTARRIDAQAMSLEDDNVSFYFTFDAVGSTTVEYPISALMSFWREHVNEYGYGFEYDFDHFLEWLREFAKDCYRDYDELGLLKFTYDPMSSPRLSRTPLTEHQFRTLIRRNADGSEFVAPGKGQQDIFGGEV